MGFVLGFIRAAVSLSPAVIIPSLMSLSGRGYGVAKGIPTLVIAACAADDVVPSSGLGNFFGITFSNPSRSHLLGRAAASSLHSLPSQGSFLIHRSRWLY